MSDKKNSKKLGAECPYAHHAYELLFPETLKVKINAIEKMKKSIRAEVHSKAAGANFYPAGQLVECKLAAESSCKCNMCRYRFMAKTIER